MRVNSDLAIADDEMNSGICLGRHAMRILWLCPYLPLPLSGAGSRVYNLIKVLSVTSSIDLIATANEWHERHPLSAELRSFCRTVEVLPEAAPSERRRRVLQLRSLASCRPASYWTGYSKKMQDRIEQALASTHYDVVIVEHSFTGYYRVGSGVPVVLDQHNVESEILQRASQKDRSRARRALNRLDYWKYRSDERRICRRAAAVLAVSERDREIMQGWGGIKSSLVIPNGVDVREFVPPASRDVGEQPGRVLFTGPLHYAPNAEAMLYFGSEIWPLVRQQAPHAQLTIVGANPPREIMHLGQSPGVTVTGFVPDVRPYLAQAQVVVAPLRIGGGTRLKILEALAMCRAVVSTSLGCEGLDVVDGRHLLVADEPQAFAARIVELLLNPTRRNELGRRGRALVEESYDWRPAGGRLAATIWDLQAERRGSEPRPRMGPVGTNDPSSA